MFQQECNVRATAYTSASPPAPSHQGFHPFGSHNVGMLCQHRGTVEVHTVGVPCVARQLMLAKVNPPPVPRIRFVLDSPMFANAQATPQKEPQKSQRGKSGISKFPDASHDRFIPAQQGTDNGQRV